jgi:two-component system cell cycle response regulator DivK
MPHALVIDDNRDNLSILVQMLSMQGVDATTIQDPTTLDVTLESNPAIDVVFVDLEMPGISGFDLLEKFRATRQFDGVPIIAYTVHVSEISVVRDRGFDGFIGKPLDADKFPQQIQRILNGEPVWSTP